jgi:putative cell wall-binding protein/peptidoglycan hydrolase-like protein with peptidoglycan-binding domain
MILVGHQVSNGHQGEAKRVRTLAAVFLVALSVAAVILAAAPVGALAEPAYEKIAGADRYQTAIQISQRGYSPGVEAVVVATGENYPDALSAAPLAAAYGGPVLLTRSAVLDEATRAEIARLQPGKIYVVGLQASVVAEIRGAFPEVDTAGGIVALIGRNRYDTARLVAEEVRSRLGEVAGAVIVPGDSFADALAVAPLAAFRGWPILLTPRGGPVPAETQEALVSLGVTNGLVVGTYAEVGVPGFTYTRLVGRDRYDTSARLAELAVAEGLSYSSLGVTTGDNFPDALAAGPYLAQYGGILLLVQSRGVPAPAASLLLREAESIGSVTFIGLAPGVAAQVKLLLSTPGLPEGFTFGTVSSGASGAEVLWLEQRLTALTYRPGPIDGVFDQRTRQAVLAFQKWEGLTRDGVVGPAVWTRLLAAAPPAPSKGGSGAWVEINKGKQVLLYVEGGTVVRTLAVSTGDPKVGITTPSGTFNITRKSNKWDGPRYKPLYLRSWGVLAIHGYPSVPAWPASHGCVRVPVWDMDELFPLIPVGGRIYVY